MSEKIFLYPGTTVNLVIEELALLRFDPTRPYTTQSPVNDIEFRAEDRPNTTVRLVQSESMQLSYLDLVGPDAIMLRFDLEKVLRHFDRDAIFECARSNTDVEERVTALFQLSLMRLPVPEPDVLQLLHEFLFHPDATVRKSAVLAIGNFEWPEARSMLDDLLRSEKDSTVLEQVKKLSKGHKEPHITGFERVRVRCGSHTESIWAEKWLDGRYAVSSIPQIVFNLSLGDEVDVESRDGDVWITGRTRSGHRTARVNIGTDPEHVKDVSALVRQYGARIELQSAGGASIDLPLKVKAKDLLGALESRGASPEMADPQPSQPNVGSHG